MCWWRAQLMVLALFVALAIRLTSPARHLPPGALVASNGRQFV
jgi:hypothetical protein